jgi:P-type Ca2+ transporter type 2C
MLSNLSPMPGLTDAAVIEARAQHGPNTLPTQTRSGLWITLKEVVSEPMFLLLLASCALYVGLGQLEEAITLAVALFVVATISIYQSIRSDRALNALRELTQPHVQVRRNGQLAVILVADLVVGDAVLTEEGERVPADGVIDEANDFSVDESILTGESVSVAKKRGDPIFLGTNTVSGRAWYTLSAVGRQTELGRIGQSISSISTEKTPLQSQINQFVGRMAWIGFVAFAVVCSINFVRSGDWITAVLFGLTLAMSILPEEIPVAFSSFMALGAARLSRAGVLTKQPQTVESLGSATVICTDKTGTITQEGMRVSQLYDSATDSLVSLPGALPDSGRIVLQFARWASETAPFDSMEKAIVAAFNAACPEIDPDTLADTHPIIHEYPLQGTPPMMTHVRKGPLGDILVAGKGAVEHILTVCHPEPASTDRIRAITRELSQNGLRVLGVARGTYTPSSFPAEQDDFSWSFLGLVALENPPKTNAKAVIQAFTDAGIRVKLITGDFSETAQAIAHQVGLPGADTLLTGQEIMTMDEAQLGQKAGQTAVFARMFPEAKLRVVNALKSTGEIVAMTGDGVNDGPALKAAHIGVAMGKRGTEVARQAASLVLVHDDLNSMVEAIAQGRRIYQNLKKAIAYIVSIHIPIILTVMVPLLASWQLANLFSPIHVIFLELVMGPTCSIAFENEPAEPGQMQQPPRKAKDTFLAGRELGRSLLQGLGISGAVLGIYYVAMQQGESVEVVRTLTFTTLVISNILLTLVNRSFTQSVFQTIRIPNPTLLLMLGLTFTLLLTTLFVPAARELFGFNPVPILNLGWCGLVALMGVGWVEVYKLVSSTK